MNTTNTKIKYVFKYLSYYYWQNSQISLCKH